MKIFRRSCILPQQSEREGGDWGKEIDCRRLLRCHRRKKQCIHENRRIDSPFFRSILEILPPSPLLLSPSFPSPLSLICASFFIPLLSFYPFIEKVLLSFSLPSPFFSSSPSSLRHIHLFSPCSFIRTSLRYLTLSILFTSPTLK